MRVVFLSNKITPHQVPFCEAMYSFTNADFVFIETMAVSGELPVGWNANGEKYPYVISSEYFNNHKEDFVKIINESHVVITGSAPESLINERKDKQSLIFRYSERPLKKGNEALKFFPRLFKWRIKGVDVKNTYMLCASAYTAADYAKFGLFKNKCYTWGYFPETVNYEDIDELISQKKKNSILWVARIMETS